VFAGAGNDTVYGSCAGGDRIVAGSGNNLIYTYGNGSIVWTGNGGTDKVYGSCGKDIIIAGTPGTNYLYGGGGDDTYVFDFTSRTTDPSGGGTSKYVTDIGTNIIDDASGCRDVLMFVGMDQSDVTVTNVGKYDVLYTFAGVEGSILIKYGQDISCAGKVVGAYCGKIESVVFVDSNPYEMPGVDLSVIGSDLAANPDAGLFG
jgi:Ca2+-binding RTX toxin-like protein